MVTALKCDNILECFFGLNELDVTLYKILLGKTLRSQELARYINRSENAVYKSLQKLIVCGLVVREKKCAGNGGYYYIYRAVDPRLVAESMVKEVEELKKKLMNSIEEFEARFSINEQQER